MARTSSQVYRDAKVSKILEGARMVFCRKGYLDVTMQDIIDECKISRGGIYLYFSSVDQIFKAVSARRVNARFAAVRKAVGEGKPFGSVLDEYMALQKERLLHIDTGLLRAMYEYMFSGAEGATLTFRSAQLDNLRMSVRSILSLGAEQNVIQEKDVQRLTDHFIVVIEGLSVMALSEVLSESIVDQQFEILNGIIAAGGYNTNLE